MAQTATAKRTDEQTTEQTTEQVAMPTTNPQPKGINPKAMIKPLGIAPELVEEFRGLKGEEAKMASAHIKSCLAKGIQPVPPSQWVKCPHPDCDYRTPNSLISHIKAKHGGTEALAAELSTLTGEVIFAEQIQLVSPALSERFKAAGARGEEAKKAKKAAEGIADEDAAMAAAGADIDPDAIDESEL